MELWDTLEDNGVQMIAGDSANHILIIETVWDETDLGDFIWTQNNGVFCKLTIMTEQDVEHLI